MSAEAPWDILESLVLKDFLVWTAFLDRKAIPEMMEHLVRKDLLDPLDLKVNKSHL